MCRHLVRESGIQAPDSKTPGIRCGFKKTCVAKILAVSIIAAPNEWMTELESLRNEIDKISVSTKMSDGYFMIYVLTNLNLTVKNMRWFWTIWRVN